MPRKETYRIRNWAHYNEALVQRGNLNLWLDEEVVQQWHQTERTDGPGRPALYSDFAIEAALMIRSVFHLSFRATEGFIKSLISFSGLNISCPDYSCLCKRQKKLNLGMSSAKQNQARHVVADSTGLKVYGEGEWKVRQHGYTKRRTWRKLHLAIDSETHGIEAVVLTTNDFKDSEVLPDLMEQIEGEVKQLSGDGGYDSHETYEYIASLGASTVIPPRKDAVIAQHGNCKTPPKARDEVLRAIRKVGRKNWKRQSGYHKRSLAETAMFRFKTLFGNTLSSREFDNQGVEALIKCKALNKMTSLGMPDSYIFRSF